jgi:hypothetical protein
LIERGGRPWEPMEGRRSKDKVVVSEAIHVTTQLKRISLTQTARAKPLAGPTHAMSARFPRDSLMLWPGAVRAAG